MSANDARFAGTTCSSAPGPAARPVELAIEAPPLRRVRRGRHDDARAAAQQPPTSSAAIEPGAAPVTSAVSPRRSARRQRHREAPRERRREPRTGRRARLVRLSRHGHAGSRRSATGRRDAAAAAPSRRPRHAARGAAVVRARGAVSATAAPPCAASAVELRRRERSVGVDPAGERVVVGGDEVPARARPGRREAHVAAGVEARGDLVARVRAQLGVEDRARRSSGSAVGLAGSANGRPSRRRARGRSRAARPRAAGRAATGAALRLGRRGAEREAEVGAVSSTRAVEQVRRRRRRRASSPPRADGPGRVSSATRASTCSVSPGARSRAARRRARNARARQPGGERLAQVRRPGSGRPRPARAGS